jgi:hypothetical protein
LEQIHVEDVVQSGVLRVGVDRGRLSAQDAGMKQARKKTGV